MLALHRAIYTQLIALAGAIAVFGTSCSSGDMDKLTGRKKGKQLIQEEDEKIDVRVSVKPKVIRSNLAGNVFGVNPFGFDLASATDFVFNVSSCASNYDIADTTITGASSTTIKLYKDDRACAVGLKQFTFDAKVYVQNGGGYLTTGSSTFENQADATDTLHVSVTNLASPIVDGATASFSFHQIVKGADYAISNYSYSETVEVKGVKAPNFTVESVTLEVIAANGVPTFDITTQCGRLVTEDGATNKICEQSATDEQKFTDMKVKIVANDPLVYTGNVMTYAEAEAAMAADTTSIANADFDNSTANDGFIIGVSGPGALYDNKDMFFIISYTDPNGYGTSYRYFRVTIGDPQ